MTKQDEEYAKNWQVNAVGKDVSEIKGLISSLDKKLEDKFATREYVESQIKLVNKEYSPLKKLVYWIGGILGALIIGYAFQLIINLQGVVSK